ncbi:hypothetical protein KSP39_PZI020217 [Platanthera zijinensis]|uniref:Uncharacterized protein n=1 Tax=Platanthera zijinensis TaxID=2320716 RepID=A0AAP0FWU4_9ASPA
MKAFTELSNACAWNFFGRELRTHVHAFIAECAVCQQNKSDQLVPAACRINQFNSCSTEFNCSCSGERAEAGILNTSRGI